MSATFSHVVLRSIRGTGGDGQSAKGGVEAAGAGTGQDVDLELGEAGDLEELVLEGFR